MGTIVNFKPGQLETENNRGAKVHPAPLSNGNNWQLYYNDKYKFMV